MPESLLLGPRGLPNLLLEALPGLPLFGAGVHILYAYMLMHIGTTHWQKKGLLFFLGLVSICYMHICMCMLAYVHFLYVQIGMSAYITCPYANVNVCIYKSSKICIFASRHTCTHAYINKSKGQRQRQSSCLSFWCCSQHSNIMDSILNISHIIITHTEDCQRQRQRQK